MARWKMAETWSARENGNVVLAGDNLIDLWSFSLPPSLPPSPAPLPPFIRFSLWLAHPRIVSFLAAFGCRATALGPSPSGHVTVTSPAH